MFVQGGVYRTVIDWIIEKRETNHGVIIRNIYENWFVNQLQYLSAKEDWKLIISDSYKPCLFDIQGEEAHGDHYFPSMCFKSKSFRDGLLEFLVEEYDVPRDLADAEKLFTITSETFGKKKFKGLIQFNYDKDFVFHKYDVDDLVSAYRHYIDGSRTQRARRKLFGLFPL